MDIGKEHEKEIWITAPDEQPVEQPLTIPEPSITPAPVTVPAGV